MYKKGIKVMQRKISFSNIIFIFAISIFFYGMYKIYIVKQNLSLGACPIEDNRPILYLAIIFMIFSIIISYIEDIRLKRR